MSFLPKQKSALIILAIIVGMIAIFGTTAIINIRGLFNDNPILTWGLTGLIAIILLRQISK